MQAHAPVFIGLYSTLDMSRARDTALREPLRDRGACELILKLQHGAGCALAQTPYGFLIRRTIAAPEEKPPLYAAHFALSHLCLLVAYPLAGRLGAAAGMRMTFAILGTAAAVAGLVAQRLWPPEDDAVPD